MKKILYALLFQCLFGQIAIAQFSDDFNDGDWTKNPTWSAGGLDSNWIVNSKNELQVKAKTAGFSALDYSYTCEQAMVWEILVRMEFAPSTANRLLLHLTRNTYSVGTPSRSYLLTMGEDGTTDKIKLERNSSGSGVLIGTCQNTFVVNNQVNTRLRIKRDAKNFWTIEADYNGGYAFKQEAAFQESNPYPFEKNTSFLIFCEYTDSRKDKFFFDDIKVYKNEPDVTPPTVLSASQDAKLLNRVNVVFSEVVDSVQAKNVLSYTLSKSAGSPIKITYNYDRVSLDFQNNLQAASNYDLLVYTITDLAKNVMKPQTVSFTTATAPISTQPFDLIINEIMADPFPQIGLPKTEFVELYNRSSKTIDLQGFSLKDKGATAYKLPKFALAPDRYVIIYKRDKAINFGKYGDTLALATFFALDSDNEEISLFNEKNELIDRVNYGLASYQDDKKSDGGWSLERINPETPCLGGFNFIASKSDDGGTPGKKNSVFSSQKDQTPLSISYAFPTSDTEILLHFNKNFDLNTLQNTAFEIETGVKSVVQGASASEAKVTLFAAMQKGKVYAFKIKNTLKDCIGNAIKDLSIPMGVPESISPKDVVINEVLFNPKKGGVDFIEVYNRSKKIVNLNDLNIDNQKKLDVQEITTNYLLLPNSYAVLTENKSILLRQGYDIKNPNAIIETKLPSFDDDEGNVQLIKADAPGKQLIDAMDYEKTYHYPLLKDQSGVSLERINPDGESNNKNNWFSAASTVGFATPTYQNSQFLILQNAQNEGFTLSNTRLSPDGDGFEDYLLISYKNDLVGLTATARVFDLDGRLIKTLAENQILGSEGELRWDGDTDTSAKASLGIYILLIEYFSPDGSTGKGKKIVSVVGRL
jgi:Lamin Tail Domain/Bacterial Ig-like domain